MTKEEMLEIEIINVVCNKLKFAKAYKWISLKHYFWYALYPNETIIIYDNTFADIVNKLELFKLGHNTYNNIQIKYVDYDELIVYYNVSVKCNICNTYIELRPKEILNYNSCSEILMEEALR